MKRLFVRIVKSESCLTCQEWLPRLDKQGYSYEVYDGDADENQNELDAWGVNVFPVIQIISRDDDDNVEVEHQWEPGKVMGTRWIDIKKKELERKINDN